MPFIIISTDLIKKTTKERLSRVIYELEAKGIKYLFQKNEEDEEAFQFLQSTIDYGKENAKYDEVVNSSLEAQLVRLKATLEGTNISTMVKKEFTKFIKSYNNNIDDIKFLERTFLGKLISLSSILHTLNLPSNRYKRVSFNFSLLSDNIIFQENFKLKYLFKALNIVVKEEILDELDSPESLNLSIGNISVGSTSEKNLNNPRGSIMTQGGKSNSSVQFLANWKPQGRILGTLYDHDIEGNNSVERLLNLNIDKMNKFVSFSSNGNMILWDVLGTDNDMSVEKISSHQTNNNLPIQFNRAVYNVDYNQFAVGTKKIMLRYTESKASSRISIFKIVSM